MTALVSKHDSNQNKKEIADIDLQRLLGKHEIDTSIFDRSLKRLAMTTAEDKLAVVEVKPESIPHHSITNLVSKGYRSHYEMALGNAVDKTLLRLENETIHEISTFSSKGLRKAIETVFDDKILSSNVKLLQNKYEVSLFTLIDKKPDRQHLEKFTPFLPGNKLANDFCSIIEEDAFVGTKSPKELVDLHLKAVSENVLSRSKTELWKIIQDMCSLTSREEYSTYSLSILSSEFQQFIMKAFPSTAGIIVGRDILVKYLQCLKKESDEIGQCLNLFSNSLISEHSEAIDPTFEINIYALLYFHLRSGFYKECLDLLQHWKEISILPYDEEFLIEVFAALLEKRSLSEFTTKATQVFVKIVSLRTSPWRLAIFQLFEGSQMNGSLRMVYSSIQDYVWQNVFIHCHISVIPDIGEDILELTQSYFKNIGDEFFYAKLLIMTLQLEEACLYLFKTFENDTGSLSFVIHVLICLNRAKILQTHQLSFNKLQSISASQYLRKDEFQNKQLAFSRLLYDFTYSFVNSKLSTAIAYLSSLYTEGGDNTEVISLLGHLLAESNQYSYLLDEFKPRAIVPTIYSKKGEMSQKTGFNLDLVSKRNGVLYMVKCFGSPIIESSLKKAVELANSERNLILSFNLMYRSQVSAHQKDAVENILGDQLVEGVERNKKVWFDIVHELDRNGVDFEVLRNVLVPFTKFQLALEGTKHQISSCTKAQEVFDNLRTTLSEIKSLIPMNPTDLNSTLTWFKSCRKKVQIKLFLQSLRDCVEITESAVDSMTQMSGFKDYSVPLKAMIDCQTSLFTRLDLSDPTIARKLTKLRLRF